MKKVDCNNDNCIHTLSGCADWNGGDIESLGICNGQSLNDVVWEIVLKLQDIVGEDISSFDIDSLINICGDKAPLEITLISVLNALKNSDICLKDLIDTLSQRVSEIATEQKVNVDLKCFADFDNIGNQLSLTKDDFDQLVINTACGHQQRIESLESGQVSLQSQINSLGTNASVDELSIATCVNAAVLPTSTQLINTAQAHCDLQTATGSPSDIAIAMAKVPATDNARYGLISGWILVPTNEAQIIGNLLLKIANLEATVIFMQNNCCALTCEDIKLGFTAIFNEDGDGVIIKFTAGSGTIIPSGFVDKGSTITITDSQGNTSDGIIDIVDNFNNNLEYEILVNGLDLNNDLAVDITAKIGTDAMICEKCLHKAVRSSNCGYCTITATGAEGSSAVIVYEESSITTTTTLTL